MWSLKINSPSFILLPGQYGRPSSSAGAATAVERHQRGDLCCRNSVQLNLQQHAKQGDCVPSGRHRVTRADDPASR